MATKGAVVPTATTVSPTNPSPMPSRCAIPDADRTSTSAPTSINARPPNVRTISATSRCWVRLPKNRLTSTVSSSPRGVMRAVASMTPREDETEEQGETLRLRQPALQQEGEQEDRGDRQRPLAPDRPGIHAYRGDERRDRQRQGHVGDVRPDQVPDGDLGLATDGGDGRHQELREAGSEPADDRAHYRGADAHNRGQASRAHHELVSGDGEHGEAHHEPDHVCDHPGILPRNDKRSAGCRPGFPALLCAEVYVSS